MNGLKKFWIAFLSFLPFTAGAAAPILIGGLAGVGVIAGFSIYRTAVPVDMADALSFFSSCWSCQMFADIMATMSSLLPRAYHAIGSVMIPVCASLTAVYFAWRILSGYLKGNDPENPWKTAGAFGTHIVMLTFVIALLAFPLPRLITDVVVEPVFNIGLSLNRVVAGDDKFAECVVATAVADPVSVDSRAANAGAYSPKLRHNLACELANVHKMTAVGMTAGWTMLNMSFDADYMHKILWNVPFFPNVPIFLAGMLILALFFFALLPIPIYLLEVFIKLSMDLIMLPFMLMSWLFSDWGGIFPKGGKTIQGMINDVVQGTVGIAMVGIFVTFSVMFISSVFGSWQGADVLAVALANNDSKFLIDGLMMNNDSLITIILMGLFIAMFMNMIPALIKSLFKVEISDKFYKTTKSNVETVWKNLKKWYSEVKK